MCSRHDSQPAILQEGPRHKTKLVMVCRPEVWLPWNWDSNSWYDSFSSWFNNSAEFEQTGKVLVISCPFTADSLNLDVPIKLHKVALPVSYSGCLHPAFRFNVIVPNRSYYTSLHSMQILAPSESPCWLTVHRIVTFLDTMLTNLSNNVHRLCLRFVMNHLRINV
jgi:hypothetical protein